MRILEGPRFVWNIINKRKLVSKYNRKGSLKKTLKKKKNRPPPLIVLKGVFTLYLIHKIPSCIILLHFLMKALVFLSFPDDIFFFKIKKFFNIFQ